jgi:hypothetical protein
VLTAYGFTQKGSYIGFARAEVPGTVGSSRMNVENNAATGVEYMNSRLITDNFIYQ